ncbi:MAG: SdiA-regulated family protein [Pedobacter sp.]|nr:MAG: SdiA-regulated family protein [Pedobacter sp.]
MPSSLLEVSGIAFHNAKSEFVYSVQDEEGRVFKQKWGVKKQTHVKFASNGDFEDLAILKDKVIVLKSNGYLYTFGIEETLKQETDQVKESKKLVPKEEYESIYADQRTNKVYILCKSCEVDKKAKQVTGYVLNYDLALDSFSLDQSFKIDITKIPELNPKLKASLSPSAMTKNSLTNEWYILSSMNKLLVITDMEWNIKGVHKLNSSTFNQPEGLAFDAEYNLFISNEGDEVTDGNILKFKYGVK